MPFPKNWWPSLWAQVQADVAGAAKGPRVPARRTAVRRVGGWLIEPKNSVLITLCTVLVVGLARRWRQARRAQAAVARLEEPGLDAESIEAVAEHGRAGIVELFRILGTAEQPALRTAAGRALASLWARDELVPEEEQAIARRGFEVAWHARRRYPRALERPIPIAVSFGVPFLPSRSSEPEDGPLASRGLEPIVHEEDLEWSHRILGAQRAGLEAQSKWHAGNARAEFTIEPRDFVGQGPHRLVLAASVRTRGLTSTWEIPLPQMPMAIEFDPQLTVDALLAPFDAARAERIASALALEPAPEAKAHAQGEIAASRFLDLTPQIVMRDPPVIALATPLPCDLAHRVELEFEGVAGRFPAGEVVVSGQGGHTEPPARRVLFPLAPPAGVPPDAFNDAGERAIRVHLVADLHLAWSDPDLRSLWPGEVCSAWQTVRLVRR